MKEMLEIPKELMRAINKNGEDSYPEEGAGLLLGRLVDDRRVIESIYPLKNAREDTARHNRYLITPQDMLRGEQEAMRLELDVLGVFHSHPDHPNRPSEFDREWALPWFSYLITSVVQGSAQESRSWRLREDRQAFDEEELVIDLQSSETMGRKE
jgi:proteasome lid subunit RPN8/RPN11